MALQKMSAPDEYQVPHQAAGVEARDVIFPKPASAFADWSTPGFGAESCYSAQVISQAARLIAERCRGPQGLPPCECPAPEYRRGASVAESRAHLVKPLTHNFNVLVQRGAALHQVFGTCILTAVVSLFRAGLASALATTGVRKT